MAMAYLTLFLSHISNVSLMREFLRFLVKGSYDGRSVLSTIILGVSSSSVKVSHSVSQGVKVSHSVSRQVVV